jgi:hypothetical protein
MFFGVFVLIAIISLTCKDGPSVEDHHYDMDIPVWCCLPACILAASLDVG